MVIAVIFALPVQLTLVDIHVHVLMILCLTLISKTVSVSNIVHSICNAFMHSFEQFHHSY